MRDWRNLKDFEVIGVDVDGMIAEFDGLMEQTKELGSLNEVLEGFMNDKKKLVKERDRKIEDINDHYEKILMKQGAEIENFRRDYNKKVVPIVAGFERIQNVINMLTGKREMNVPRYDKEDVKAACYHEIHFFDDLYESDVVSLKAVIVGDNTFMERIRGKATYVLFVFGYVKYEINEFSRRAHSFHDYFNQSEDGLEESIVYPYVCFKIRTWSDVKTLVNYYECDIKGMNGKKHEIRMLNELIAAEKSMDEKIKKVKGECSLEDFMPILSHICPECGKDGVLKNRSGNVVCERCKNCGKILVPVR